VEVLQIQWTERLAVQAAERQAIIHRVAQVAQETVVLIRQLKATQAEMVMHQDRTQLQAVAAVVHLPLELMELQVQAEMVEQVPIAIRLGLQQRAQV
jgi:glycine cleavage system regulatory protein